MSEKNFKLFREKSIEAIESPESLNDYLNVTSPGVWLLLAAVIVTLLGVVVWGIFGTIQTHVKAAVVCMEEQDICIVPYSALSSVIADRVVTVDGKDLTLNPSSTTPVSITEDTDIYLRIAGGYEIGDIVYYIPVETDMEDGIYAGSITTEALHPISLLLN